MGDFIKKIKKFLFGETMRYLFFGGLTTIVSLSTFRAAHLLLGDQRAYLSNIISFIAAVSFAYITNKLFVFKSMSFAPKILRRELGSFLSARLLSFAFEEAGIIIASNVLNMGRYTIAGLDGIFFVKILLSVIVVLMNYFFSKFLVFKNGGKPQ
jgi:putative flippase GtrA